MYIYIASLTSSLHALTGKRFGGGAPPVPKKTPLAVAGKLVTHTPHTEAQIEDVLISAT